MDTSKRTYEYTQLAAVKAKKNEQPTDINIYGVVVDANHPYKANHKYICSFKIVDPSLNIRHTSKGSSKKDLNKNFATAIFYANSLEQLPHVPRVGDIVRIHRAQYKEFENTKQFNVNLFFRSSYLLFHLDPNAAAAAAKNEEAKQASGSKGKFVKDEEGVLRDSPKKGSTSLAKAKRQLKKRSKMVPNKYLPYSRSSENYTLTQNDIGNLEKLRIWAKHFLSQVGEVIPKWNTSLDKVTPGAKNLDLLCLVHSIEVDPNNAQDQSLLVKDPTCRPWRISYVSERFSYVKKGDVVRIRAINVHEVLPQHFVLNDYSNVMVLPKTSKASTELRKAVDQSKVVPDLDTILSKRFVLRERVYLAKPTESKHKQAQQITLDRLSKVTNWNMQDVFRIKGQVVGLRPENPKDAVRFWNNKTKKEVASSSKDTETGWAIEFAVKSETAGSATGEIHRVLLYSVPDGLGQDFFEGVKAGDLVGGKKGGAGDAVTKIENYFRVLQKYNVWVDMFVNRLPTPKGSGCLFQIRDTVCSMKHLFNQF